jgi:thiol-disulfide isomerase/thioredoxin
MSRVPNLRELLSSGSGELLNERLAPVSVTALFPGPTVKPAATEADEKIIGLYFSANWCPPCHQFLPTLRKTYAALRQQGRDIEIVFVSWDNNEAEFRELTAKMPWLRMPYGDARSQVITKAYGITSIPTLIFVRARDNAIITRRARMDVVADPTGKNFPWPNDGSGGDGAGGFSRQAIILALLFALFISYRAYSAITAPAPSSRGANKAPSNA